MKTSRIKLGILCGSIAAALSLNPAFAAAPATNSTKTAPPATEEKSRDKTQADRWSDRIFDEFQSMQQRMDRIFNDALHQVNNETDWFDETSFSSSVKMSEDHGDYVVRLSLPERDLKNVEANVEGQTLRITAKEEKKERTTDAAKAGDQKATVATYELGRYEQLLTLPGPVDASKMKIDRSGSTVTITLPKAQAADGTSGKG